MISSVQRRRRRRRRRRRYKSLESHLCESRRHIIGFSDAMAIPRDRSISFAVRFFYSPMSFSAAKSPTRARRLSYFIVILGDEIATFAAARSPKFRMRFARREVEGIKVSSAVGLRRKASVSVLGQTKSGNSMTDRCVRARARTKYDV